MIVRHKENVLVYRYVLYIDIYIYIYCATLNGLDIYMMCCGVMLNYLIIYILLNCFTSCVQGYCVTRLLSLTLVYRLFVIFCADPSMMLPF